MSLDVLVELKRTPPVMEAATAGYDLTARHGTIPAAAETLVEPASTDLAALTLGKTLDPSMVYYGCMG